MDTIDRILFLEMIERCPEAILEGPLDRLISRFGPSDQQRINKAVFKLLARKFDSPFSEYLEKYLNRNHGKNTDSVQLVKDVEAGNKTAIAKATEMIGRAMLFYYEKAIGGMIFKTSLSGDKHIDRAYRGIIDVVFNSTSFYNAYAKAITSAITKGVAEVRRDSEFKSLIGESELHEKLGIIDRVKKTFSGKDSRMRYEITDSLLELVPKVDGSLKKLIKDKIFTSDYKTLLSLRGKIGTQRAANALAEVILGYMVKKSIKNFETSGDPFVGMFVTILKSAIGNNKVQKLFENDLSEYFAKVQLMQKQKSQVQRR